MKISAHSIDSKNTERRYRNILANSGMVMESGEVRDLPNLYVMTYDGQLVNVNDLDKNPDKQTEEYSVKAQADHGEMDADGIPVSTIEKQFGSCRVWTEQDGLHARMYFADGDALADHAFAISQDASYSIGCDWFPEGYNGAGIEIDEPIGILREISMVITGNDPRAKTIDQKPEATGADGAAEDDGNTNNNKEIDMPKNIKTADELTRDERDAFVDEITAVVDKFTADVPESETEPTVKAEAKSDAKDETEENAATTSDSRKLRSPVVIVRDRVAKQTEVKQSSATADYLKSEKAVDAWATALVRAHGSVDGINGAFAEIAKTRDGVTLGTEVSIVPEAVLKAVSEQLEDEDSIFAHVFHTGLDYEIAGYEQTAGTATGHVRGKTKVEENVTLGKRVLTPADLYKLMKLDHSMVKLNGGVASSAIVRYVMRELPRKLREAIDQAIVVGGIKNDDGGDSAATDFTALISVLSDVETANSDFATKYNAIAGDNLRATIAKAASKIRSGNRRALVITSDSFVDIENAVVPGTGTLLFPNGINRTDPKFAGLSRVFTPSWLTAEMLGGYDALAFDLGAYHTVGDSTAEEFADYDIDVNKYVWEQVACVGGGLADANAAVGIKFGQES